MIDILFVNPPSPDEHIYIRDINRSGRRSRERTIWPQTSLALLAAVMEQKGYSVDVWDCIGADIDWKIFKERLRQARPDYLVAIAVTTTITNDIYTTFLAKALGTKTIIVGPHITNEPEKTMACFPTVDYGILGESEETLPDLLDVDRKGGDLKGIKGIVFRNKDALIVNPERELIADLDSLPIPLHEKLPLANYRLPYVGKNITFVLASRGCPFNCIYCRQPIMWRRVVRSRSAVSMFSELEYVKRIGVENVAFHSDTFTIRKDIVLDLCKLIIENGLRIRWICNSRVDTVDEEMLSYMKRAGCWMIAYGIESGSDIILRNAKKGGEATVEKASRTVKMTKKAGIQVWGYFIIGLPGETWETIDQTIRLSKSLPLDFVNFAVGAPYPGTEFYEMALENGWLESLQWEDFDQNYSAIVSYPELTSDDVIKAIRKAYKAWVLRPSGLFAYLKGFNSIENMKTLLAIGWRHLLISKEN